MADPAPSNLATHDHAVAAFNRCTTALHFLHVLDLAMDDEDEQPGNLAVRTVLAHIAELIEYARDAAERARKGAPHA